MNDLKTEFASDSVLSWACEGEMATTFVNGSDYSW